MPSQAPSVVPSLSPSTASPTAWGNIGAFAAPGVLKAPSASPSQVMTMRQLQRECVRRGLRGYSRLRKAELIALLVD
jgi:hypothetical protein